jgi:esterase
MLNTQVYTSSGPSDNPPLLIVHGLFGSARNWGATAKRLSAGRRVIVPDMRNHGESPQTSTHSYADLAADLAEVLAAHGAPADVLGHSMGGKAAMVLALSHPGIVRRMVVADIAPVAYAHDQRQHVQAMRGLPLEGLTTRAEADRRLAASTPDPALRAFFLQSLDLRAEGGPRWRLNLDTLDAEMPAILGWPAAGGRFDGPTLFLSGADSRYVLPEHRPAITALFPAARFARIPGAGHWLHAEKPREFEAAVQVFLDSP